MAIADNPGGSWARGRHAAPGAHTWSGFLSRATPGPARFLAPSGGHSLPDRGAPSLALLYDLSQTAIPFDDLHGELLKQPMKWNPADIGRFMLFFGPVSSLFDLASFAVMWHVFMALTVAQQGLFQSGWFVEGACSRRR